MNCVNISRFGMCKSADIFCLFIEKPAAEDGRNVPPPRYQSLVWL